MIALAGVQSHVIRAKTRISMELKGRDRSSRIRDEMRANVRWISTRFVFFSSCTQEAHNHPSCAANVLVAASEEVADINT